MCKICASHCEKNLRKQNLNLFSIKIFLNFFATSLAIKGVLWRATYLAIEQCETSFTKY